MKRIKIPLVLLLLLVFVGCSRNPNPQVTDPNLQKMIDLREDFRLAENAAKAGVATGLLTKDQYNDVAVPASKAIHNAIDDGFVALEVYNSVRTDDKLQAFNSSVELVTQLVTQFKAKRYQDILNEVKQ